MTKNHSYITTLPAGQYDLQHTQIMYQQAISPLHYQLHEAHQTGIDPEAIALAKELIERAREFDIQQAYHLMHEPYGGSLQRDLTNPPSFSAPFLVGQDWADNPVTLLDQGEEWNSGRRRTNPSIAYATDENGLPVNPYLHYGVRDRGIIGRYGPNHAVDDGILRVMPNKDGKPALHALGIIRQDNGLPALCGGFTNFSCDTEGRYLYGQNEIVTTQAHEFFEELISGSVELLPEYAEGLDQEIAEAIAKRTQAQGREPTDRQKQILTNEITTHRKLCQVHEQDPAFLENVASMFSNATECYAGPVLASSRNTDTSWMETYLSWTLLDEETWSRLKGDRFDYDFKAGDDAQDVLWHEINPELMATATGSHDAFFAYMLSSYLLTQKGQDADTLDAIKDQAKTLIDYFPPVVTTAPTLS